MKYIVRLYHLFISFISNVKGVIISALRKVVRTFLDVLLRERSEPFQHYLHQQYTQFKNRFYALFDQESAYYKPVMKVWRTALYCLLFGAFYIFCVETNFLWLMGSMPSVDDLQNPKVAQSSEIYTSDGILLRKLYTENRTPVSYDKISPVLVQALIATEDIRFHAHSGIDPRAMGAVFMSILKGEADRGGGSTITQQLAKKLFKTRRRSARGLLGRIPGLSTIIYKTKEWLTAIKLERNFTKEEIITMYLNTVDFGQNTFGIKTAAKTYFSKEPADLTVEEAAVLVGLQKATTTYNPIRNPERSRQRRDVVLGQMHKYGFLTQQETDSLIRLPLVLKTNFESPYDDGNSNYYIAVVEKIVEQWGKENDYNLYTDGLRIYTTIDSRLQTYAEEAVTEKMRSLQRVFEEHWRNRNPWIDDEGNEIPNFLLDVVKRTKRYGSLAKKFPSRPDSILYYLNKKDSMTVYDWQTGGKRREYWSPLDSLNYYKRILRSGMMSMNPYTGHIKAWVGGLDYEFFKYDHVKQSKRQPGSTFKPFVYAAAIDDTTFNMSPCDRIQDKPFEKEVEDKGMMVMWRPRNSTGFFTYANLTLRRALAQSVNSVTAALTDMIGPANVVRYAKNLGITSPLDAVPSIGLGTNDVSLYEMVAAYSSFVNSGTYTSPILVLKIEDRNGNILHEFTPEHRNALRPESAFLMVHMLKGGIEEPGGTSRALWGYNVFGNRNEIGGKTGTTSNNSDGWYMCITRELVTGAWVGGEDRSIHFRTTNLGEGSKTALPIVGRYLEKVYRDKSTGIEPGPFSKPTFKITKEYDCMDPYEPENEPDSTDSTASPARVEEDLFGPPPPLLNDTTKQNGN